MKMNDILKVVIVLFLLCCGETVCRGAEPEIKKDEITDLQVLRTEKYGSSTLWGYMDGAADLYLEYGFHKLIFQELQYNSKVFRLEIFSMKDPESAYGIFSAQRFRCESSDSFPDHNCLSPYQFQTALDTFYISITGTDSTQASRQGMFVIAKAIVSKLQGYESFKLPEEFSSYSSFISGMKCIKGLLGLQNLMPEWEEEFDGIDEYTIYSLPVKEGRRNSEIMLIRFSSPEDAQRFISSGKKQNGKKRDIKKNITIISPGEILYKAVL